MDEIRTYYTRHAGEPLNEIEFRLGYPGKTFNPNMGVIDFDTILKRYMAKHGQPRKSVLLTIISDSLHVRIETCDNIKAYALTGNPGTTATWYTKKKTSYTLEDHPLRVSFGLETPVGTSNLTGKLFYRYAQRFSFHPAPGLCYDFTVVHEGVGTSLAEAGVLDRKSPEKYEIEIEFTEFTPERVRPELDYLLCQYHGGLTHAPLSQLTQALNGYIAVCNSVLLDQSKGSGLVSTCIPALQAKSTMVFEHYYQGIVPDISEILTDATQVHEDDYVVTDKADGRRALLYTYQGLAYLIYKSTLKEDRQIQSSLVIIPTGCPGLCNNSVYDGEFLLSEGLFLCFDVLYSDTLVGKAVPFSTRLAYIEAHVADRPRSKGAFNICRKQFVRTRDLGLLNLSRDKALVRTYNNMSYNLDGLIFQRLSVPYPSNNEKWRGTMKWKPPSETTIDFKILPGPRQRDDPVWRVSLGYGYNLKCKYVCHIPLEDGVPRVKETRAAVNVGDIIECRLVKPDAAEPYWEPLRLRRDKRFPNSEITYTGNMLAIRTGIELGDLTRKRKIDAPSAPVANPMYTVNKYNRRISNQHIYSYLSGIPQPTVFEFAVGSAQSSSAWKFAGAREIVGFDIDPDTATNVIDSDNYLKTNNLSVRTAYYSANMCSNLDHHPELATITSKFDFAVCNFAIHYAFQSAASLTTFLQNVARYIKPGGYFIGTYMDAKAIAGLPLGQLKSEAWTYEKTARKVQVTHEGKNVYLIDGIDSIDSGSSIYGKTLTVDIVERPLSKEYAIHLNDSAVHLVFQGHGFIPVKEEYTRNPIPQFKVNYSSLNPFEKRWADIHQQFVFRYQPMVAEEPKKKLTLKRKQAPTA